VKVNREKFFKEELSVTEPRGWESYPMSRITGTISIRQADRKVGNAESESVRADMMRTRSGYRLSTVFIDINCINIRGCNYTRYSLHQPHHQNNLEHPR
jgi:hypothetical protein